MVQTGTPDPFTVRIWFEVDASAVPAAAVLVTLLYASKNGIPLVTPSSNFTVLKYALPLVPLKTFPLFVASGMYVK